MILGMEPKIRSIGPPVPELWLSLNLAVKEQNERVYKCDEGCETVRKIGNEMEKSE